MPATVLARLTRVVRRPRAWRFWGLGVALMWVLGSMSACANLPPPPVREASRALADPTTTTLGKRVATVQPSPTVSGLRVVVSGADALATLMTLADQAERTLDLQYYLVHNEPSTRALLRRVRLAADRGVRVRLLVDDLNTANTDAAFRRLTEHPRIEVRLYNPLPTARAATLTRILGSIGDIDRINRRMHNKVYIADNAVAFTGGRNLGDAYFLASDKANFVDLDVVVAGPAVRSLSTLFDRYWNSELAYPVHSLVSRSQAAASSADPGQLDNGPPAEPTLGLPADAAARSLAPGGAMQLHWAVTRLLADQPEKIEDAGAVSADQTMFDDLATLLKAARQEVAIISPYLVPGERVMALLRELRQRGVRVRVLTSGLASTDAPIVHVGYARYRGPMLDAGIELHEMRSSLQTQSERLGGFGTSQALLHAKALVVDRRFLLIGSMNLDPRSIALNSEHALLVNSPRLSADVLRLFDELVARSSWRLQRDPDGDLVWIGRRPDGTEERRNREPDAGLLRRLSWRLLGPFAPDEML